MDAHHVTFFHVFAITINYAINYVYHAKVVIRKHDF